MITTLIDKQDNFEIVRDQIVTILKAEVVNQMALAVLAAEDQTLWDLNVTTERFNPIEKFLKESPDIRPIVTVWVDSASYDRYASN